MATAASNSAGFSAASEAFRKCSADLIRGIQDPELLAWELYSDDVISETVVDEVSVVGLSGVQRKTRLLSAVRDQLAVDPNKLQNLLQALRKQPPLKDVAEKLETIYHNCAVSQPQKSGHKYTKGAPVDLLREIWYHTMITRETAEKRLEHGANGCFLIRESETKSDCFSLSLKHPGGIVHFPIKRKDSGLYEVPGTHKAFTTIPDLIEHFKHHPISEDPHHQLISPCHKVLHMKDTPPPLPPRSHVPTKHTANTSFKSNQPPNGTQRSSDTVPTHGPDSKSLWLHPHSRLRWRRVADLPVAMSGHHIVRIGSNIYCGGGFTGNDDTARVFQYNPKQDTWSQLPICPTRYFGLTQLDGKLVIVGGEHHAQIIPINDVYVFQESETWENSIIPPLPTARFYPAAFNYKSTIVVSGGIIDWKTDTYHSTRTNAVEVFQTKTFQWHHAEPLPAAHSDMSCVIVDDTCYLIGGVESDGYAFRRAYCTSVSNLISQVLPPDHPETSSTPQASPSSPIWQVLPECPLYCFTAAELGGCLLAIGGRDSSQFPSSAVHMYSPSTNSWVRISSGDLPVPRSFAAATQLEGGEVIFAGGNTKLNSPTKTVFIQQ